MVWSVIAAVAAVIAALAALVTIVYARLTVLDGREAHLEETTARSEALVADIRLQRLVHVSRLTDVLTAIARAAHDEATSSVVPIDTPRVPTIIPSLQGQLRAELAAFRALGAQTSQPRMRLRPRNTEIWRACVAKPTARPTCGNWPSEVSRACSG